jgi:hypothetical protein
MVRGTKRNGGKIKNRNTHKRRKHRKTKMRGGMNSTAPAMGEPAMAEAESLNEHISLNKSIDSKVSKNGDDITLSININEDKLSPSHEEGYNSLELGTLIDDESLTLKGESENFKIENGKLIFKVQNDETSSSYEAKFKLKDDDSSVLKIVLNIVEAAMGAPAAEAPAAEAERLKTHISLNDSIDSKVSKNGDDDITLSINISKDKLSPSHEEGYNSLELGTLIDDDSLTLIGKSEIFEIDSKKLIFKVQNDETSSPYEASFNLKGDDSSQLKIVLKIVEAANAAAAAAVTMDDIENTLTELFQKLKDIFGGKTLDNELYDILIYILLKIKQWETFDDDNAAITSGEGQSLMWKNDFFDNTSLTKENVGKKIIELLNKYNNYKTHFYLGTADNKKNNDGTHTTPNKICPEELKDGTCKVMNYEEYKKIDSNFDNLKKLILKQILKDFFAKDDIVNFLDTPTASEGEQPQVEQSQVEQSQGAQSQVEQSQGEEGQQQFNKRIQEENNIRKDMKIIKQQIENDDKIDDINIPLFQAFSNNFSSTYHAMKVLQLLKLVVFLKSDSDSLDNITPIDPLQLYGTLSDAESSTEGSAESSTEGSADAAESSTEGSAESSTEGSAESSADAAESSADAAESSADAENSVNKKSRIIDDKNFYYEILYNKESFFDLDHINGSINDNIVILFALVINTLNNNTSAIKNESKFKILLYKFLLEKPDIQKISSDLITLLPTDIRDIKSYINEIKRLAGIKSGDGNVVESGKQVELGNPGNDNDLIEGGIPVIDSKENSSEHTGGSPTLLGGGKKKYKKSYKKRKRRKKKTTKRRSRRRKSKN